MKKKIKSLLGVLSAAILACVAFTGCATTGADGSTSSGGGYTSIIMIVVLIAVFYFFMIRPENKKKKAEEMRNSLSVGDKITTIGGMVGKVVDISGDLITFETGEDRVRVQVTKWAISTNSIQKEEQPAK